MEQAIATSRDAIESCITKVEEWMEVGNFLQAIEAVQQFGSSKLRTWVQEEPLENPFRAKTTTVMAELYFYRSQNHEARGLLQSYLDSDVLLAMRDKLLSRGKLQLAQAYYTDRDFPQAVTIVQKVLDAGIEMRDMWGEIDCHYYLAKFYCRQDEFANVHYHCQCALNLLQEQEDTENSIDPMQRRARAIQWRSGLVQLVSGYASWLAGHLDEAEKTLRAAGLFLKGTADYIHKADVIRGLGCLYRSTGRYDKAIQHLEKAMSVYRTHDHKVHQTRILVNLGKTYCECDDLANAKKHYDEALQLSNVISNQRQQAQALICLSNLYKEESNPDKNYQLSKTYGEEALKILSKMENSRRSQIQARLSLGDCYMKMEYYKESVNHLTVALRESESLKIVKFQISAHLYLAELHCSDAFYDKKEYIYHYNKAKNTIDKEGLEDLSKKISKKFEDVEKKLIGYRNKDYIMFTVKELERDKLKILENRLQYWALAKASERKGSVEEAAVFIGKSTAHFYRLKKKMDADAQHVGQEEIKIQRSVQRNRSLHDDLLDL